MGGTWQIGGCTDYWSKVELGWHVSPTQNQHDAIRGRHARPDRDPTTARLPAPSPPDRPRERRDPAGRGRYRQRRLLQIRPLRPLHRRASRANPYPHGRQRSLLRSQPTTVAVRGSGRRPLSRSRRRRFAQRRYKRSIRSFSLCWSSRFFRINKPSSRLRFEVPENPRTSGSSG